MAKKEKVETKASNTEEFKFGVKDVADELNVNEATARMKLRNAGIEKAGRSYGWNSQKELKDVVSRLKSGEKAEKPKPKVKAAGTETAKPKAKVKAKAA